MGVDILDILSPHRPFSFAGPAPSDAAGLEFTLPDNWAHFTLPRDSEPSP